MSLDNWDTSDGIQATLRYHKPFPVHVHAELPLLAILSLPMPVCNTRRRCLSSSIYIRQLRTGSQRYWHLSVTPSVCVVSVCFHGRMSTETEHCQSDIAMLCKSLTFPFDGIT